MSWRPVALRLGAATCSVLICGSALALSEDEAIGVAQLATQQVEAEALALNGRQQIGPKSATERLAIGEMLQRNGDHDTAIDVLNQVLELYRQGKADDATHADALFLLAESYFRTHQLTSARRHLRELVSRGNQEDYAAHTGRALSRLVDVALRRRFPQELDFVFEQLAKLGNDDPDGSLRYARGKASFSAGRYDEAIGALTSIPASSPMAFQAEYLLGVVYTNQAAGDNARPARPEDAAKVPEVSQRFALAILQFQRVTTLTPRTPDQQHVVDLAWMALGRLFYETENPLDAVDAYARISRESPEFATMLFELAWVYVQLEDFVQAQDTLEVLEIYAPESLGLAEGALLRADLMLRSKQFPEALLAYQSVRNRFAPAYEQLEAFLEEHSTPAAYYDSLVEQRLGARTSGALPPAIMEWVREVEDERAFALIDDVTRSRQMITESVRLAKTMGGVLSAPTKARAFPVLRTQIQQTLGLLNKLQVAKRAMAEMLGELDAGAGGELAKVRSERQALMAKVAALPVELRDFLTREAAANRQWDSTSQTLQQLSLETDSMRAIVNGLRRMLREADEFGIAMTAARKSQLQRELKASEADLDVYQKRITEYREQLERGRLQVGFGGSSYAEDERLRRQFSALVAKEFALARSGAAGEDAAEFAARASALLERIGRVEARIATLNTHYTSDVDEKAAVLLREVEIEAHQVSDDSQRLDVLDQQARHLFGEVAMHSFSSVKDKLGSLLLRADIGIAQEAWEVRQAHFDLMQNLQRLRAKRESYLNDEFKEVLHDGGEEP